MASSTSCICHVQHAMHSDQHEHLHDCSAWLRPMGGRAHGDALQVQLAGHCRSMHANSGNKTEPCPASERFKEDPLPVY